MDAANSTNVSNQGLEENTDTTHRTLTQISLASAALTIVLIMAIVGNLLVILAIYKHPSLREEQSNLLIVNLSITDLASAIFVMLSALISLIADEWVFSSTFCDIICALNYCLIIVSMLTLCFIGYDRYQAVSFPLSYNVKVTKQKILAMILYSWFQGISFCCVPPLLNWIQYDYWEAICAIQWHKEYSKAIYYVVVAFLMCFLIPGLILLVCYFHILRQVKQNSLQVNVLSPGPNSQERKVHLRNTNCKTIISLLIVVLAYFICMTPFSATKLLKVSFTNKKVVPHEVNLMAAIFGYISCAINPLIYGIFRKDFRNAYKRIIKMCSQSTNSWIKSSRRFSKTAETSL